MSRRAPTDVFMLGGLAHNQLGFGRALLMAGRHEEAVAAFRQGLETVRVLFGGDDGDEHGRQMVFAGRVGLAMALRARGRVAEADAESVIGRKVAQGEPELLVQMAGYYASGITPVGATSTDVSARHRQLAEQAMDALTRAVRLGFKDRVKLQSDPDLAPIRVRPDFQSLLMDLAMPADPFRE